MTGTGRAANVILPTTASTGIARVECPWCHILSSSTANLVGRIKLSGQATEHTYTFECSESTCRRFSLITFQTTGNSSRQDYAVNIYPPATSQYNPIGVPPDIAKDFREAQNCLSAGFLFGAALVGRRVLQAAVRSIVGQKNSLAAEINELTGDHLPRALRDAAHEIRFIGNDAAHVDDVSSEEASDLLSFTEAILHQLYVIPAQVAEAAARRGRK